MIILRLIFLFDQGGQKTTDEMCLQTFAYYPRLNDLFVCVSSLTVQSWLTQTNITSFNSLNEISWTPESIDQWQQFFLNSSRTVTMIGGNRFIQETIDPLHIEDDLIPSGSCEKITSRKTEREHLRLK